MSTGRNSARREQPGLVADIGGTHARFALASRDRHTVENVIHLLCADYAGPAEAIAEYLRRVGAGRPELAAIAIAAPVTGDRIRLINNPWSFSRAALERALGVARLVVINDFSALAHALPLLRRPQYRLFAGPRPRPRLPMAVVGPGTGLGVAGIAPTPQGWLALPGEGGHATLAAGTPFEFEVLRAAGGDRAHLSAERLLSGRGLPRLHRAVAAARGERVLELEPPEITRLALRGDACALDALDVFCGLLGSFAGNVALTLGARGGVFIGGGVVPKLGDMFLRSRFRERFEDKGRLRPYLEGIATPLITAKDVALVGAAAALP